MSQWCHPTNCAPLVLLPSVFPQPQALCIRWPKYWNGKLSSICGVKNWIPQAWKHAHRWNLLQRIAIQSSQHRHWNWVKSTKKVGIIAVLYNYWYWPLYFYLTHDFVREWVIFLVLSQHKKNLKRQTTVIALRQTSVTALGWASCFNSSMLQLSFI